MRSTLSKVDRLRGVWDGPRPVFVAMPGAQEFATVVLLWFCVVLETE